MYLLIWSVLCDDPRVLSIPLFPEGEIIKMNKNEMGAAPVDATLSEAFSRVTEYSDNHHR